MSRRSHPIFEPVNPSILIGISIAIPLLLWPIGAYAAIGAALLAAFCFIALPEIVRARRWRRRKSLGCCAGCGADLRDESYRREGYDDVLRCPVCRTRFHTQQVRFPRPAAAPASPPQREGE